MASSTRWTWVWASSGSWWWTGRPGVLQSTGLQRVGHAWVTQLNQTALQCRRPDFDPLVGKISWRGRWQPTPVFLAWFNPWSRKTPHASGRFSHNWSLCVLEPVLRNKIPWTEESAGLQSVELQESNTTEQLNHHHHQLSASVVQGRYAALRWRSQATAPWSNWQASVPTDKRTCLQFYTQTKSLVPHIDLIMIVKSINVLRTTSKSN